MNLGTCFKMSIVISAMRIVSIRRLIACNEKIDI